MTEPPVGDLRGITVDNLHALAAGSIDHIYGPPGTGKTTTLARAVASTALARGGDSMLITSFTTTAAAAIRASAAQASGGNPAARVPDRNIGTLHSFGFRANDDAEGVALDHKIISDWNADAPLDWRITPDGRRAAPDVAIETGVMSGDVEVDSARSGDALLAAMDIRRATFVPEVDWPPRLTAFAERWAQWKAANGLVDYGDMICVALARALDGERAPGNPRVMIVDEAQDMTPAETALVLAWGGHADRLVLALDDDQAINEWRGGSAAPLLRIGTDANGNPRDDLALNIRVLDQSFRVPAAVHAAATQWISRIAGRRAEKTYHPRDLTGSITLSGLPIGDPRLADQIEKDIDAGRSVMVIASCGYMLTPVLAAMRERGLPFANRYRPAEPKWNPLGRPTSGMGVPERLYRYLVIDERLMGTGEHRFWTGDDIRAWSAMVGRRAARMTRDAGQIIDQMVTDEVPYEVLAACFKEEEDLSACVEPDVDWLMRCALKAYAERLVYPAAVVRHRGPAALNTPPPITVGTIHSTKGAEADVVYVDPSMSPAATGQWHRGGVDRDPIVRLMYVALTRAAQRLVVLHPTGNHGVPRRMLVPDGMEVHDAA